MKKLSASEHCYQVLVPIPLKDFHNGQKKKKVFHSAHPDLNPYHHWYRHAHITYAWSQAASS